MIDVKDLKTVLISLTLRLMLVFLLMLGFVEILIVLKMPQVHFPEYFQSGLGIFVVTLLLVSLIIDQVGYQANIIQLGLDQLFEARTESLF